MATSPVMRWLARGVPLTLLCDLASTADPDSHAINLNERPPGDPLHAEWQPVSTSVGLEAV